MNLLENRSETATQILENRFIRRVLSDTSTDIFEAQTRYMRSRGFENNDWYSGRSFNVTDNTLSVNFLKKHRFVDMKTRKSKNGTNRKKSHAIYNKIIWGHYNNVVREMAFGFTQAVKEELERLDD